MMMMVNDYDDDIDEDYDIFQRYINNFPSNRNIKFLQKPLWSKSPDIGRTVTNMVTPLYM